MKERALPSTDPSHPFKNWNTGGTTTTINVSSGGAYTAYYQTATPPCTYNVTISAHCNTEGLDVSVPIIKDGTATGYNTPHTFSGLSGSHTFTVPSVDASGHPFLQWATSQSTTVTVPSTMYTAYYQTSTQPAVGGQWAPAITVQTPSPNTTQMLAPLISLIATVAIAASFVDIRRIKK